MQPSAPLLPTFLRGQGAVEGREGKEFERAEAERKSHAKGEEARAHRRQKDYGKTLKLPATIPG
jgi:hypothetical protein